MVYTTTRKAKAISYGFMSIVEDKKFFPHGNADYEKVYLLFLAVAEYVCKYKSGECVKIAHSITRRYSLEESEVTISRYWEVILKYQDNLRDCMDWFAISDVAGKIILKHIELFTK